MKNLTLTMILSAALLGCAGYPTVEPPAVEPVPVSANDIRVTDHVVLITDGSGTMVSRKTFPEAKALTRAFVAGMPERDARARTDTYEAGLIGFGGDERITVAPTPFDRPTLGAWASVLRPLGGPGGGASTPLDQALSETRGLLEGRKGRAAVVVFSDGLPDSDAAALAAGKSLVSSYKDGVCIHTVHTGDDPAGAAFLTSLSKLSACGSARKGSSLNATTLAGFQRDVFLETTASTPPVAAAPDPCERQIVLRGIQFEFDRAELLPESRETLNVAVTALKDQLAKCARLRVEIAGHTDAVGPERYNDGLSNRRAAAVRSFLLDAGIPAARLDAVGYGEGKPIATNDSRDGRQQNRRVELNPRY